MCSEDFGGQNKKNPPKLPDTWDTMCNLSNDTKTNRQTKLHNVQTIHYNRAKEDIKKPGNPGSLLVITRVFNALLDK